MSSSTSSSDLKSPEGLYDGTQQLPVMYRATSMRRAASGETAAADQPSLSLHPTSDDAQVKTQEHQRSERSAEDLYEQQYQEHLAVDIVPFEPDPLLYAKFPSVNPRELFDHEERKEIDPDDQV